MRPNKWWTLCVQTTENQPYLFNAASGPDEFTQACVLILESMSRFWKELEHFPILIKVTDLSSKMSSWWVCNSEGLQENQ